MVWEVNLTESALADLRWFGKKDGRTILEEALTILKKKPQAETRNLKTLRPNPVAQRELRLRGKYRLLFNMDSDKRVVTILVVGEKRGNALVVQGEEFTAHHEDSSPQ